MTFTKTNKQTNKKSNNKNKNSKNDYQEETHVRSLSFKGIPQAWNKLNCCRTFVLKHTVYIFLEWKSMQCIYF